MLNNHGKLDWSMNQLHNGCILAGIAHAIMVAHYPVLANEHSWDGFNYSVQDSEGSRGTVTFQGNYCIGAFRNEKTDRAHTEGYMPAIEYLWNAPLAVLEIAESEAFQYMLDYMGDQAVSVITTAFWGDNKGLHINDTYDDFLEYGGFLLLRQNMDYEQAISAWIAEYEMTPRQAGLLEYIYNRKAATPEEKMVLTKEDISMIGSNNPQGLKESKISFEELSIYWAE